MATSTNDLSTLLTRSRLLSADEVQSLAEQWRSQAGDKAEDGEQFARWLVAQQLVTGYQAALLLRGHADQFFLDQYKLLERIGTGRMAGVFKAVHRLGQTVAIKVLPPSKAKVDELIGRFQREARLSVRLRHPNVVRTFQMGQTLGLHYLVMEYLEGETLEEVLKRRGRLPPAEAVRLVHQALQGLQHIHEHGVVHRDVKPGNLMLVPGSLSGQDNTLEATLKILDIGLGRSLFDENDPWGSDNNFQLTTEGSVLGEPDYLAPEQAKDAHAVDIRADIYSLGGVLFHALAGHPPFPDTNRLRQMIRHATEPVRPIRELNPAVPEGLQTVLNRLLAKDPAQRPATPEQAAKALQPFLPGGAARTTQANQGLQDYLDYVDREPTTQEAESPRGPTAAAVHSWGSLFMKIPLEEAGGPVYALAGEQPAVRVTPVIRSAARPELLPVLKEKAASARVQPHEPRARSQPEEQRRAAMPPAPPQRMTKAPPPARSAEPRALRRDEEEPVELTAGESPPPRRADSRAPRNAQERPVAAPRPGGPRLPPAEEQAPSARHAQPARNSRPSVGDESVDGPMEPEELPESSGISRREFWLLAIGLGLGAGAILLAGGLGLLLARSFQ